MHKKTLENILKKLGIIGGTPKKYTRRDAMYAEMKYERILFNYIYDRPITEGFKKELEESIKEDERDGFIIDKRLIDETIDIVDCIAYVKDPKELDSWSLLKCIEPWNEDTGERTPKEFLGEFLIRIPEEIQTEEERIRGEKAFEELMQKIHERNQKLAKTDK